MTLKIGIRYGILISCDLIQLLFSVVVNYEVADYLGCHSLPSGTSITDISDFVPDSGTLRVVEFTALDLKTQMEYLFNITSTDSSNQMDTATVNIPRDGQ